MQLVVSRTQGKEEEDGDNNNMHLIAAIKLRIHKCGMVEEQHQLPRDNVGIEFGVDFGLLSVEFYVCIAGRRT